LAVLGTQVPFWLWLALQLQVLPCLLADLELCEHFLTLCLLLLEWLLPLSWLLALWLVKLWQQCGLLALHCKCTA